MRTLHHPARDVIELTDVLYALSDPIRLRILKCVELNGEVSCSSFDIPIAKSTLSHHFKVLREAGIVFTRIAGTQRFISLRSEDLQARFPGLLQTVLQACDEAIQA